MNSFVAVDSLITLGMSHVGVLPYWNNLVNAGNFLQIKQNSPVSGAPAGTQQMCSIVPRVCTINPGDTRERHQHRPAAKHELRRNARLGRTAILRW
jgi:hypothetical protein